MILGKRREEEKDDDDDDDDDDVDDDDVVVVSSISNLLSAIFKRKMRRKEVVRPRLSINQSINQSSTSLSLCFITHDLVFFFPLLLIFVLC